MGAEDHPLRVFDSSRVDFLGMTDATIYPLQSSPFNPHSSSPLTFVNRQKVVFFHLADEG